MVDHWLKHVVRRGKDPINRPDSWKEVRLKGADQTTRGIRLWQKI